MESNEEYDKFMWLYDELEIIYQYLNDNRNQPIDNSEQLIKE